MSGRRFVSAVALLGVLLLVQGLVPASFAKPKPKKVSAADAGVVEFPVSFQIVNRNDSSLPCPADGKAYTVRGHLTGPPSAFSGPSSQPRAITILLTGFDEGEWTWRFNAVPGHDYTVGMAELGHVSLSIDMLGFGSSDKPSGFLVCWGSQADVTHQIVQMLRTGTYDLQGEGRAVPFSTVIVSAHDSAPLAALIEAYTWEDIDGLSAQIFAHQGLTPYIVDIAARRSAACAAGGQDPDDPRDNPDDPFDDGARGGGYMLFGPPDEQFRSDLFYEKRSDPSVIDAVIALRNRNPCGQILSSSAAIRRDLASMKDITIPVLLVFPGPDDPVVTRAGQEQEASNYGATDVTTAWLDSGHFMELEACGSDFQALTAHWIHERWGVGDDVPLPPVGADRCVTEVRTKGEAA